MNSPLALVMATCVKVQWNRREQERKDHVSGYKSKARICKRFNSPGIDSASLCSLVGRSDKQDYHTGLPCQAT